MLVYQGVTRIMITTFSIHWEPIFAAAAAFEAERHRPRVGITTWYSTASPPERTVKQETPSQQKQYTP